MDRTLEVGDDWEDMIELHLFQAKDVVVILSENSLKSKWVLHEGSMAHALKKNIYPLAIMDVKAEELPIWAQKIQYQRFVGIDYRQALNELIGRLTPVNQLKKLLVKQCDIFSQTNVLPSLEFLKNIEPAIKESPIQNREIASLMLLAALKNELHVDFWVNLALQNDVDIYSLLQDRLDEEEFRFRKSAIQALQLVITADQGNILLRFLQDPYPQVRKAAILGLWNIPDLRPQLLNALTYECYIPAGIFRMGMEELPVIEEYSRSLSEFDKQGFAEYPSHEVYTDDYFIDKFPITNQDYLRFLLDTKPKAIKTEEFSSSITGKELLSVTNLDWDDAYEYARWAGKNLPTEAEWEKAARGTEAYLFPWGNRFDASKAHISKNKKTSLKPVNAFSPQGDSVYGVADMVGNVWEWVSDWYQDDYYRSAAQFINPQGPSEGKQKVLRGGSFREAEYNCNAYRRIGRSPAQKSDEIGFRCSFLVQE